MWNIALVKGTKSSNILLKNRNYLLKVIYSIQNVQVSIQTYYFKFLNMCKFAHDRKTHKKNVNLCPQSTS